MRAAVVIVCFIAAVLICCYAITCHKQCVDVRGNSIRHLTNEYSYAHFSRITTKNKFFQPQLLLAHPQHFELHAGESLLLPPRWWHWVRSDKHTIAINFWTASTKYDTPCKIPATRINDELLRRIRAYKGPIELWNSIEDKLEAFEPADFTSTVVRNNRYVITLAGFGDCTPNKKFFEAMEPYIVTPPEIAKGTTVYKNLWASYGSHDTGLHYDDSLGLLHVLQGRKRITLYPPSDTPLLRPYSIIPDWVNITSRTLVHISPNLYTASFVYPNINVLPSSRLLYESFVARNNKTLMLAFKELKSVSDTFLVYGCKMLADGTMRWEVYAYHYSCTDTSKPSSWWAQNLMLDSHEYAAAHVRDERTIIHSYDIADTDDPTAVFGDTLTLYRRLDTSRRIELPMIGDAIAVSPSGAVPERKFVIAARKDMKESYAKYMDAIDMAHLTDRFRKVIFGRYSTCPFLCVTNKFDGVSIFIQYLGISVQEFYAFLVYFKYPQHLCAHVREHLKQYEKLAHEITIVYDIATLQPIRTAFYGTFI